MLKPTFLALLALFLTLVTALPTASEPNILEARGKHHHNPKAAHKPKPYHPKHYPTQTYTQPPPTSTSCPGGEFYIQSTANSNYGTLAVDGFGGDDVFTIDFEEATEELANIFTFVQNSDGTCQLGVFPSNLIPTALGFRSVIVDTTSGFVDFHYVRIKGPTPAADGTVITELLCQTDASLLLKCSVSLPGDVENVLQLSGDEMAISASLMSEASDFLLVPVL